MRKEEKEEVPYDERSGQFVHMGEQYGVGHKAPVAGEKESKKEVIPCGTHEVKK